MKRILTLLTILLLSAPLFAQQSDFQSNNPFDGGLGGGSDSGFLGFGGGFGSQSERATVSVAGKFIQEANSPSAGKLVLEAVVPQGFHMYSITQKDGGPEAARITIESSAQYTVGAITAQTAPEINNVEYYDVPIEEHRGTVVWTAPIQFAPGVDPSTIEIKGSLYYQICDDVNGTCLQPTETSFLAKVAPGSAVAVIPANAIPDSDIPDSHSQPSDPAASSENDNAAEEAASANSSTVFTDLLSKFLANRFVKDLLLALLGSVTGIVICLIMRSRS